MQLSPDTLALLFQLEVPNETKLALMQALERDWQAFAQPAALSGVNEERERLRNENTKAERKRAADRERLAAKREAERVARLSQAGNATVPSVARDSRATIASDTRDAVGDTLATPATPRARVEDNNPRLVNYNNQTTPENAGEPDLDWPETDKPSKAYLDKLEAALREACGPALASEAVAPRVRVLAPILALGKPGKGPRCELQADVLPTVRARAARSAPGAVKSWDFFRDAILEARDRRMAGAPALGEVAETPRVVPLRPGGFKSREEQIRDSWDYAIEKIAQDEQR